jgi:hypothetical protein
MSYELYKKRFVFTFTEPGYGEVPELHRSSVIELADDCSYTQVVDEFLMFLSGCWGYTITMDSLLRHHGKEPYSEDSSS